MSPRLVIEGRIVVVILYLTPNLIKKFLRGNIFFINEFLVRFVKRIVDPYRHRKFCL